MLLFSIQKLCKRYFGLQRNTVLCSPTPWCKRHAELFHPLPHVFAVTAPCSVCVFSAHLGNFKHIDSRGPDTAGCHVWRACAWRLTAQGYLKGCANFALFTAPINPICFGGSLCIVQMLDVGQSMASRVVLLLCVTVGLKNFYWCALSPVTFALPAPQGQPCHSSPPCRPGRGKCRQQQSAGRFKPSKVSVSFPLHFLIFKSLWPLSFSHFLLLHPFFVSVSILVSLLPTPCSFQPIYILFL